MRDIWHSYIGMPGKIMGPCLDPDCDHPGCAARREAAASRCHFCREQIGFKNAAYRFTVERGRYFVCAACWERFLEADERPELPPMVFMLNLPSGFIGELHSGVYAGQVELLGLWEKRWVLVSECVKLEARNWREVIAERYRRLSPISQMFPAGSEDYFAQFFGGR